MTNFNKQIKQVLILSLLIALILITLKELYLFLPGLLGALTLYILCRGSYFQLIYHHKWKKGWTAGLFLLSFMLMLSLIIYITVILLVPKISDFLHDPVLMINKANQAIANVQQQTGLSLITENSLSGIMNKLSGSIPSLLNDTSNLILNLAIMLFILYYMLVHGKEMENYLTRIIPLKKSNINELAVETKRIVKASAVGIPFISIIQGLTATLGYFIFGMNEFVL